MVSYIRFDKARLSTRETYQFLFLFLFMAPEKTLQLEVWTTSLPERRYVEYLYKNMKLMDRELFDTRTNKERRFSQW